MSSDTLGYSLSTEAALVREVLSDRTCVSKFIPFFAKDKKSPASCFNESKLTKTSKSIETIFGGGSKNSPITNKVFWQYRDQILDECLNLFLTSKTSCYRQLQEKIVSDSFTVV